MPEFSSSVIVSSGVIKNSTIASAVGGQQPCHEWFIFIVFCTAASRRFWYEDDRDTASILALQRSFVGFHGWVSCMRSAAVVLRRFVWHRALRSASQLQWWVVPNCRARRIISPSSSLSNGGRWPKSFVNHSVQCPGYLVICLVLLCCAYWLASVGNILFQLPVGCLTPWVPILMYAFGWPIGSYRCFWVEFNLCFGLLDKRQLTILQCSERPTKYAVEPGHVSYQEIMGFACRFKAFSTRVSDKVCFRCCLRNPAARRARPTVSEQFQWGGLGPKW